MARGGAEKVVTLLANHYIEKGYDVDIVLLLGPEVDYLQYPLSPRIKIIDLSGKSKSYLQNTIRWLFLIRQYVKSNNVKCVISFVGRINALVLTSTVGLHVPIVVSERNDPKRDGRSRLMLKYCNYIYKRASRIVFQSKHEQSCFSNKLSSKAVVIPNPVKAISFDDIVINNLLISTAGRLNPQKNHPMLIEAIDIIKKVVPDIRCEIYGEGPERSRLEKLVCDKGLKENVFLPGNKGDVLKYIASSYFFVLTSNFEGMSNSLLEAMTLGKVCITTDYPGAEEVIQHMYNGVIVPQNSPQALADTIIMLLRNQDLCNRLSNNAMQSSTNYSYSAIMRQWDRIIDNYR